MKSDPRYGKPQPEWRNRIAISIAVLCPVLLIAMRLING